MPVDRTTFFEIMSAFPTGVAIVTTLDAEGSPRGLTSNAVCSVSADPPLVLVCVDRTSRTLPALLAAKGFVVNFVAAGSHELAARFASKADDKFDGIDWRPAPSGRPWLHADAVAYADCVTDQEVEAGDHVILVGRVEAGRPPGPESQPLMYFRRSFS
jgi:flavin reductase (DIM6/NTAB) family NADH-FMN oxidoreductase RutF